MGSDLLSARPFAHGDDVRRIDWAATARTGELHAHTTLADRALHVHLVMDASASMRTLPVGISLYQGEFTFPWPVISAALVVAIVPIAVLIALFQERVVGGLTQGGLKG